MSNHQKRLSVPKSWPVERKTETFTVKADAGPHGEAGVPLLILLRDVLGYVDSRKEARYALNQDNVVINGTTINDEERPVGMFDILVFDEREEYYRVFPGEGGRLALTPIDADAAASKLGKIVGKRQVEGGRTQLTLHDGHTLVVDDGSAYAGSDSIVIANADDEIVAHFPFEEGALVTAVEGTHAGEIGTVETVQITPGSAPNNVTVAQSDGAGFETIQDYIVVIDENFTSDDGDEEADEADEEADSDDEDAADTDDESVADEADESVADEADETVADEADETAADEADETVADEADESVADDEADESDESDETAADESDESAADEADESVADDEADESAADEADESVADEADESATDEADESAADEADEDAEDVDESTTADEPDGGTTE